jgi:hypothetical protein
MQPPVATSICSRWLAESNAFSDTSPDRRRFLGAAGMTIAAAGFGTIEAGAAQPGQARSFGALKQIDAGVLNIGYAEVGPTAG